MSDPLGSHPYGAKGPLLMIITWVQTVLALIIMAARLYVNVRLLGRIRADFWWAVSTLVHTYFRRLMIHTRTDKSQVVSALAQITLTMSASEGLGNHEAMLTNSQISYALKWSWIGQISTIVSVGLGKLAIIEFLLQIQNRTHKKQAWFLYFVGWSNMVLNVIQIAIILLQCTPTAKLWNKTEPGSCANRFRTNASGYFKGSMKPWRRRTVETAQMKLTVD